MRERVVCATCGRDVTLYQSSQDFTVSVAPCMVCVRRYAKDAAGKPGFVFSIPLRPSRMNRKWRS